MCLKLSLFVFRSLKRSNPHLSEDVVLIRALRDSNLPKFLVDDALLFGYALNSTPYWPNIKTSGLLGGQLVDVFLTRGKLNVKKLSVPLVSPSFSGILSDLFPGVTIPEHDYGVLQSTIEESLVLRNLQQLPSMTKKVRTRTMGFVFIFLFKLLSTCSAAILCK